MLAIVLPLLFPLASHFFFLPLPSSCSHRLLLYFETWKIIFESFKLYFQSWEIYFESLEILKKALSV